MKTRDELAEVFVVSVLRTFGPDDSAEWEAVVKDGFNLADAFVAERERRAGPVAAPLSGIDAISAGVRAVAAEFDRMVAAVPTRDPLVQTGFCIGGHHGECPGNGVGAFAGPCGCDCHDATPTPRGLKFTASGALLSMDGHRYATRENEGYSADASKMGDDFSAIVRIAARDRDHAERIVAAMLPVGRGTP